MTVGCTGPFRQVGPLLRSTRKRTRWGTGRLYFHFLGSLHWASSRRTGRSPRSRRVKPCSALGFHPSRSSSVLGLETGPGGSAWELRGWGLVDRAGAAGRGSRGWAHRGAGPPLSGGRLAGRRGPSFPEAQAQLAALIGGPCWCWGACRPVLGTSVSPPSEGEPRGGSRGPGTAGGPHCLWGALGGWFSKGATGSAPPTQCHLLGTAGSPCLRAGQALCPQLPRAWQVASGQHYSGPT